MSFLALFIEVSLLALGVYIYLFSRGAIQTKDPERQKRAEAFRKDNATWMRLLGLGLAAVMLLNVVFHVAELLK